MSFTESPDKVNVDSTYFCSQPTKGRPEFGPPFHQIGGVKVHDWQPRGTLELVAGKEPQPSCFLSKDPACTQTKPAISWWTSAKWKIWWWWCACMYWMLMQYPIRICQQVCRLPIPFLVNVAQRIRFSGSSLPLRPQDRAPWNHPRRFGWIRGKLGLVPPCSRHLESSRNKRRPTQNVSLNLKI